MKDAMHTGSVHSWVDNPQNLGAVYPFVGWEIVMAGLGLFFWIAWVVWQLRQENATYRAEAESLRKMNLEEVICRADTSVGTRIYRPTDKTGSSAPTN